MNDLIPEGMRKRFPYYCQYVEKYGVDDTPPVWRMPTKYRKNPDELVYKPCIEQGKPWYEIFERPKIHEGIIY